MKWSSKEISELIKLARYFDKCEEKGNAEIAEELKRPVKDVWAERSQLGITRAKVKALKGGSHDTR
jgi:uncharacterized membrane protein